MEKEIRDKIGKNSRIDDEEAIWLLEKSDLFSLSEMATERRRDKVGKRVFYRHNFNINYTNICVNKCALCAFFREMEDGYTMPLSGIEESVRLANEKGVNEVHIVGGLNPDLGFDYFLDMMRIIKGIDPSIHIQAFTAVEIDFFARNSKKSSLDVLKELKEAGLGTLPGGGAEIFSGRVRERICRNKISAERWLAVHEEAHSLDIQTNATMLYGHIETPGEIVDHLSRLRDLQDRTGGFQAFVPLSFFSSHTRLEECPAETHGILDMKVLALARIYLDNFAHLKSLWMTLGYKACQVGLEFGADDIGATYYDEYIVHSAGAKTPRSLTKKEIITLAERMGREAVEVNSRYEAAGNAE